MNGVVKYWLLFFILLMPFTVCADTVAPPRSYVQASGDDKFLFVMIAPIDLNLDGNSLGEAGKKEARRVRETYPASGMYLNDGSTIPLWTVDWHSNRVFVSSDGEHVVRLGPWATKLSNEAFTFFKRDRVLRVCQIGDLVDLKLLLPHSVSHFMWNESLSFNDDKRTFAVSTLSKENYVFDYTTGKIISARRPVRMIGALLAVLILGSIFIVFRHRWHKAGERRKASNKTVSKPPRDGII